MKEIYIVQEIDSNGNITTEMFNDNRENAIKYLKSRHAIIKQNYKGWNEEVGINYYAWKDGDKFVKLYLKIMEADNTNDRKGEV